MNQEIAAMTLAFLLSQSVIWCNISIIAECLGIVT